MAQATRTLETVLNRIMDGEHLQAGIDIYGNFGEPSNQREFNTYMRRIDARGGLEQHPVVIKDSHLFGISTNGLYIPHLRLVNSTLENTYFTDANLQRGVWYDVKFDGCWILRPHLRNTVADRISGTLDIIDPRSLPNRGFDEYLERQQQEEIIAFEEETHDSRFLKGLYLFTQDFAQYESRSADITESRNWRVPANHLIPQMHRRYTILLFQGLEMNGRSHRLEMYLRHDSELLGKDLRFVTGERQAHFASILSGRSPSIAPFSVIRLELPGTSEKTYNHCSEIVRSLCRNYFVTE